VGGRRQQGTNVATYNNLAGSGGEGGHIVLASWAHDSHDSLGDVITDHRGFASVVRHELKRSERYCSFMSMLTVMLENLDERLERKFPVDEVNADCFVAKLSEAIKSTVRSTDVVSNFDRDRVGLLLVETPRDGATVLARRLEDHLSTFLNQTGELTSALNVRIEVATFPDDSDSIERMLRDFAS